MVEPSNAPEVSPAGAAPARDIFERPGAVALIFAALAVLMTWPLAIRLTTHVPAGAVDLWQNYWNFWWWKTCLLDLHQSPYFASVLFHPTGASMAFYTHSPFNMLAALPFAAWLGPGAAYNFCVLLALTLSGWTAWLLVREITGEGRAGFVAGLVYSFFPHHMEQTLEHLNLFSIQFIPLALFFVLRVARGGGVRNVVGLGVALALNATASFHLAILLTMLVVPVAVVESIRSRFRARDLVRDYALAIGLSLLIALPFMLPMLREQAGASGYFQKPPELMGIDPVFLLAPSPGHPLFGWLTAGMYRELRAYPNAGFMCFLGFVPLALAVLAASRRIPGWRLWGSIFVASLVLALGSRLWWAGQLLDSPPLPFALLERLPGLGLFRVANRFMIAAGLALAVLAGLGWSALKNKSPARFAVLAALIGFEFLGFPYPTRPLPFSPLYEQLAASGSEGAVLDLPFTDDSRTVLNMAAQTLHERPIAGAYLSTTPPEAAQAIRDDPVLSRLSGLDPRLPARLDVTHLRSIGFGFIVVHKYRRESVWRDARERVDSSNLEELKIIDRQRGLDDRTYAEMRELLDRALGGAWLEDDSIAIYSLGDD